MVDVIKWLKTLGISIAVDDFGNGNLEIKSIIEYQPDYVKIDRYLINEIEANQKKQLMIKMFQEYCDAYGIQLIAEGIEEPKDLAMIKSIGIPYGQGYVLGKPSLLQRSFQR